MSIITRPKYQLLILSGVVLFLAAGACSSRYRLNLAVTTEGIRKDFKVEQTQFVTGGVLADPYSDPKVATGDGNAVVLTLGTRWDKPLPTGQTIKLVSFDEYLRMRLYLGLPAVLEPGLFETEGRSFVQLLERYDWSPEARMFVARGGFFTVDSVVSKMIFVTIDNRYQNQAGDSLNVSGQFKLKISN